MKKFDRVFTKNLIGLQILAPENGHLEIRESEVEFKIWISSFQFDLPKFAF